jgi:hypothetical protein
MSIQVIYMHGVFNKESDFSNEIRIMELFINVQFY